MKHATVFSALVLGLLFIPFAALAEDRVEKLDDTEIHYNAMYTADMAPEVAKAYHLKRGEGRGVLTISVLRKNASGVLQSEVANVTAYAANLSGQLVGITLRELREGAAIYYLGEFHMNPPVTLRFHITAKPRGMETHSFQFEQSFYPSQP